MYIIQIRISVHLVLASNILAGFLYCYTVLPRNNLSKTASKTRVSCVYAASILRVPRVRRASTVRLTFNYFLLRSVTLICILTTNYEYDANSPFFRLCYDDCIQEDAVLEAGHRQTGG